MQPVLRRGQLVTWKDERGFGFIKSEDGGKEVFLHITAIKGASRRPQVGDTILYECVIESGKVRAANASIQGLVKKSVAARPKPQRTPSQRSIRHSAPRRPKGQPQGALGTIATIGFAIALAVFLNRQSPSRSPSPIAAITQPECTIKGNISQSSGIRYYHLPGMEDYENTVIDLAAGEKWFCSEQEAIAAGWRRAPQ
ncbi:MULTISPECIES: cold shock domain-containing protein [unclassified Leptolyngbya]|uniref:cold-shock protein n=1 Tax=unclassified Leptolyngbya TaxID=2650499 RepID=UPI0016835933|nr:MULTISPECIES: cold shock domain-containing protein [unclassified Leptolyngbya]MBD1912042.1 cold shock domain-containing protein [Leptolyngbya sp. FACHB-8]MBD2155412.1 cold shock domain-containing protein [Leptolyngbya sp. FACHB-16]